MSLALVKTAQNFADDDLLVEELMEPSLMVTPEKDEISDIEVHEPKDENVEILFNLDKIPGATSQDDLEVGPEAAIEVSGPEDHVEVVEKDDFDWQSGGLKNFLNWVKDRLENVPPHSGKDTSGIERAIAYFEAIDKEISRAMRTDFRNEIDSGKVEEARETIEDGLERLVERLDKVRSTKFKRHSKKNKKADYTPEGMVKEAQKAPHIAGMVVTIPLLISRCARVCINGVVSAGHDLEDMFNQQVKQYKLTDREQAELAQCLEDFNYPIMRDRAWPIGESGKRSDQNNSDWNQNFPA